MSIIQGTDRDQYQLWMNNDQMIGEDNSVRVLDALIETIAKQSPEQFAQADGNANDVGPPRYAAVIMVKLLLYGYYNRIKSSRMLEKESHRNIELRWLIGELTPDHWTIAHFRKSHHELIVFVQQQFSCFLVRENYIAGHTVAVDGTRIKANAGREILRPEKVAELLREGHQEIAEYLTQLDQSDTEDNAQLVLLEKIAALEQRITELETLQQTMDNQQTNHYIVHDPDSRMQKTREGIQPGYNVQAAVDSKHHMVVQTVVSNHQNDMHQLPEVLHAVSAITPEVKDVLADSGYYAPEVLQKVEHQYQVECYTPLPVQKQPVIQFTYDATSNSYQCSEGKRLTVHQRNVVKRNAHLTAYRGTECHPCSRKEQCTSSRYGRTVYRYDNQDYRDQYKQRMRTVQAQQKNQTRKTIIEHVFGSWKLWMGKNPLLLRGRKHVATEMALWTMVYNLKRLLMVSGISTIMKQLSSCSWMINSKLSTVSV